jgi:hypothetical protein
MARHPAAILPERRAGRTRNLDYLLYEKHWEEKE